MTKITGNISELRKILNEEPFDKNMALEFLDAIDSNVGDLNDEIVKLENDLEERIDKIHSLRDKIEELEEHPINKKIGCGIGDINYENPSNLALQDIMENLDAAIQKTNFKKVNEILYSI